MPVRKKGSAMSSHSLRFHIEDEVEPLQSVIVHRPGNEMREFAAVNFDQIFYLRAAQGKQQLDFEKALEEHDGFTALLRHEGIEVLEVEDLLAEALETDEMLRASFVDSFIAQTGTKGDELQTAIRSVLESRSTTSGLARIAIEGIRCRDAGIPNYHLEPLAHLRGEEYDADSLLAGPMNILFFTRDPAVVVEDGVVLCNMYWPDRAREALIYRTIFGHHPLFSSSTIWHREVSSFHIEGGNIMNLSAGSVVIGISQRAEAAAVDHLARLLFAESPIREIVAIALPDCEGRRLHLDAFLSKVDHGLLLADPLLLEQPEVYRITPGKQESICIERQDNLAKAIEHALGIPVSFVPCGGSARGQAAEQEAANGASSVLTLAPGKVCACQGNPRTAEALYRAGVDILIAPVDELVSGFGGPSSLCMPLRRGTA